jgi:hypothetical protein
MSNNKTRILRDGMKMNENEHDSATHEFANIRTQASSITSIELPPMYNKNKYNYKYNNNFHAQHLLTL